MTTLRIGILLIHSHIICIIFLFANIICYRYSNQLSIANNTYTLVYIIVECLPTSDVDYFNTAYDPPNNPSDQVGYCYYQDIQHMNKEIINIDPS